MSLILCQCKDILELRQIIFHQVDLFLKIFFGCRNKSSCHILLGTKILYYNGEDRYVGKRVSKLFFRNKINFSPKTERESIPNRFSTSERPLIGGGRGSDKAQWPPLSQREWRLESLFGSPTLEIFFKKIILQIKYTILSNYQTLRFFLKN